MRSKKRSESKIQNSTVDISIESTPSTGSKESEVRPKRRKLLQSPLICEKTCIICNKIKCQGDNKRLRICETRRAKLLLSAVKFNKDDVHTRCILYKVPGNVFAADVMYHKKCFK